MTTRGCIVDPEIFLALVTQPAYRIARQFLGLFAAEFSGLLLGVCPAQQPVRDLDVLARRGLAVAHGLEVLVVDLETQHDQQGQHEGQRDHQRLGHETHLAEQPHSRGPEAVKGKESLLTDARLRRHGAHGRHDTVAHPGNSSIFWFACYGNRAGRQHRENYRRAPHALKQAARHALKYSQESTTSAGNGPQAAASIDARKRHAHTPWSMCRLANDKHTCYACL